MNFLLKLVVFSWYFWGKALYNGLKTSPDLDITVCSSHTTEYLTIESIFQLFHDSFKLLIMTDGCGISTLGMPRFSISRHSTSLENTHYVWIEVFVYFCVASRKLQHFTQWQQIKPSKKNTMNEKKEIFC